MMENLHRLVDLDRFCLQEKLWKLPNNQDHGPGPGPDPHDDDHDHALLDYYHVRHEYVVFVMQILEAEEVWQATRNRYVDNGVLQQLLDYILSWNHVENGNLLWNNYQNDDIYEVFHMFLLEPDNEC